MGKYNYDLIVVGAGAAGFVASKVARGLGKSVAMIEKGKLGGECTNYGCIPSKSLIRVGKVAHELKNLEQFGLKSATPVSLDTDNVMAHVRSIVQEVYDSHLPENFKSLGIDVHYGSPRFVDNHTVAIEGKTLSADRFMISTGSSPAIPPIDGMDKVPYHTNNTIFSIDRLPQSMIVLGGGPIGMELASAFNRLGVEVTLVEMLDRILFREDRELGDMLAEKARFEGLKILTSTRGIKVEHVDGKIKLHVEGAGGTRKELAAEEILVASGRKPNTDGLELENAGVKCGKDGIEVDGALQTSSSNIFACGDVVGPYRFSHMAEYQAIIACRNAFLPIKKKVDYSNVIWCTFTDPELAHAGMTEEEARKEHGDNIKVRRFEYGKIDRARTDLEKFGMSKVILDGKGRMLGAHILGSHASEVIHELQMCRHFNIPFSRAWEPIHIYPSYADVIRQPSKYYYAEKLGNNPVIKLLKKLF